MSIAELVEEIESLKIEVAQDPYEGNPAAITGRKAAHTAAVARLNELLERYADAVRTAAVAIIVVGKNKGKISKFREVVEDEGSSVVVDVSYIFDSLASEIRKSMGSSRTVGVNELVYLRELVVELAEELEIPFRVLPEISVSITDVKANAEELDQSVRDFVVEKTGLMLPIRYIDREVIREATEISYSHPILPVVIFGMDKDEAERLSTMFGKSTFVIDLTRRSPSLETLTNTYRGIKTYMSNEAAGKQRNEGVEEE